MSTSAVVLVTGANRGIGFEIARRLVARGAQTIVTARQRDKAEAAAREVGAVLGLELDISDVASAEAAGRAVAERFGRLTALINNAGILLDQADSLLGTGEDVLRRSLETNTLGPLRVARACWPLLKPGGRVINVSSGGGQLSDPSDWAPAYCLSKTALNGVTVQLAKIGARDGIAVNSVCPGWVRTDMGGSGAPRTPGQGADTPVWLALDAPANLSGQFLRDRKPIPW